MTTIPAEAGGKPPTKTPLPTDTPQPAGDFYVDCSAATNGDGSLASPWNDLATVNGINFGPGSSILFKRGTTCSGQLSPGGSGSSGSPIVIDAYGTGDKPHIAGGAISEVVYLYNQEYWEIRNLEVTNSTLPATKRRGIHISLDDFGTGTYYRVLNNTVHDIAGDDTKDLNGSSGIHFTVHGSAVQSKFSDVVIEGNTVYTVDRSGINMSSAWWCREEVGCYSGQDWYPWDPFIIRSNLVYDTGGDGIVNQYANGSTIEYNVVHDCNVRSNGWNVGIWGWNADNMTFQYNEAYLCRRDQDGQGFDIDYGQVGTIHQYEYSHDNEGGFILICGNIPNGNRDGILRYSISQNDLTRVFEFSGSSPTNIRVYNNTVYVPAGNTAMVIHEHDWSGYPDSVYFYNNIFYHLGSGDYVFEDGSGLHFDHNLFYGNHPPGEPDDPNKITADPLLVNPGSGGLGIGSVGGYQLQAGSSALEAGRQIADNGGEDYWGNPVPQWCPPDVGAHQYSPVGADDCPTPVPTDTPEPTVTPTPIPGAIHVEDVYTTDVDGTPKDTFSASNREVIYYRVQVKDQGGAPIEGALVTTDIQWPGGETWTTQESTTGADGWALFEKNTTKPQPKGPYTVVVTDVTKSGETYDPNANVKDSHEFLVI